MDAAVESEEELERMVGLLLLHIISSHDNIGGASGKSKHVPAAFSTTTVRLIYL
jgi:hypothetical protein